MSTSSARRDKGPGEGSLASLGGSGVWLRLLNQRCGRRLCFLSLPHEDGDRRATDGEHQCGDHRIALRLLEPHGARVHVQEGGAPPQAHASAAGADAVRTRALCMPHDSVVITPRVTLTGAHRASVPCTAGRTRAWTSSTVRVVARSALPPARRCRWPMVNLTAWLLLRLLHIICRRE